MGFDEGSRRATALLSRYLIVFLGLLLLLNSLGFNRNALLAVAGGLSIGVGFGIREVIANLISGVWLLFEGSVRQAACFWASASRRVSSQPWMYCVRTAWISPNSPLWIISRAWRTSG